MSQGMLSQSEPIPTPRSVSVLPRLCHLSPWGAPSNGLPDPVLQQDPAPDLPSPRTMRFELFRRRPGKCQVLSSWGKDGSVHPHCCQNHSQWQELVSAAMSVGTAPENPGFATLPHQSHKEQYFPQSCNCPSTCLPYLVGWLIDFLACHGYLG